jgi:hypothetical protein
VAENRDCEQCGSSFVPRREHARFCSPCCRAVWNRAHVGDAAAGASALVWALAAMSDAAGRLVRVRAWDRPRALVVIGETVWWVTMADATLVRHHLQAYDAVLAAQAPAEREVIEGMLAGLRFVRNRIGGQAGLAGFTGPGAAGPDAGTERVTAWVWKPVPEPALAPLAPRGRAWERTRYRAYQAHLAGHTVGETFGQVTRFVQLAADAAQVTGGQESLAGRRGR